MSLTKRILAAALFIAALSQALSAQVSFRPPVEFYGKETLRAASHNWAVAQGRPGEIYAGNDEGLLRYDGYRWELHRMPGGIPVYSILVDGERIYTGGIHEFGYWTRTEAGELKYTSLSARVEKNLLVEDDIWTIVKQGERIVFHAYHALHIYDGSEDITTIPDQSLLMSVQLLNDGKMLVWRRGAGPAVLEPSATALRPAIQPPFRTPVAAILPAGDSSSYVITYREGIYRMEGERFTPFPTQADDLLKSLIPRRAAIDPHTGNLIVGTHLGGVLILSPEGELIWWLGEHNNTLPGKQLFGMELDSIGNLWLAMERGIAKVSMGAPIRISDELDAQLGTLNTAAWKEPYLYLGTSTGLWRGEFSSDFRQVDKISRVQDVAMNVLDLSLVDGQLFCGSNGPTYEILPDGAVPVSSATGGAEMDRGVIHGKEVLLQRTHSGLCFYLKDNNRWVYSHFLEGFPKSVRGLRIDAQGAVWLRMLYGGLHKIQLDESLTQILSDEVFDVIGNADATLSTVSRFRGRVLFRSSLGGYYTYDDLQNQIVPYEILSAWAEALAIEQLGQGKYAFRFPEGTVFVQDHQDSIMVLERISSEMLGGIAPDGLRYITPLPQDRYLFLRENSLALCQLPPKASKAPAGVTLSRFVAHDYEHARDSLFPINGGTPRIPSRFQRLQFYYDFPQLCLPNQAGFRYKLKGSGKNANAWEMLPEPAITLHHLREGRYSLLVEAVSMDGEVLSSFSHSFVVRPPFRRSIPMQLLYLLLCTLIPLALYLLWKNLIESRRQVQVHKEESQIHKSELDSVRAQLAARTARNIHWNETLQRIRDLLTQQKQRLGRDYPDKDYRAVCEIIDSELISDTEWNAFEKTVNEAYDNYLIRLQETWPELTETDLRHCAYIKMGTKTKDVAKVLHVTLRGVEAARYRIKRKLELSPVQSLDKFLREF